MVGVPVWGVVTGGLGSGGSRFLTNLTSSRTVCLCTLGHCETVLEESGHHGEG